MHSGFRKQKQKGVETKPETTGGGGRATIFSRKKQAGGKKGSRDRDGRKTERNTPVRGQKKSKGPEMLGEKKQKKRMHPEERKSHGQAAKKRPNVSPQRGGMSKSAQKLTKEGSCAPYLKEEGVNWKGTVNRKGGRKRGETKTADSLGTGPRKEGGGVGGGGKKKNKQPMEDHRAGGDRPKFFKTGLSEDSCGPERP